jgi:hypothetical protein
LTILRSKRAHSKSTLLTEIASYEIHEVPKYLRILHVKQVRLLTRVACVHRIQNFREYFRMEDFPIEILFLQHFFEELEGQGKTVIQTVITIIQRQHLDHHHDPKNNVVTKFQSVLDCM